MSGVALLWIGISGWPDSQPKMGETNRLRIGLTGGIGSGKSTVAAMFAGLGIAVLDLDQVGRDVVLPGSEGLQQLVSCFGLTILTADGTLNRSALAQHCFADAAETAKLNAIMHPLIQQAEDRWFEQQHAAYAIIEASVLLESGGASRMDSVLVVLADEALRCERVLARGDRNRQEFKAIVARQCDDKKRRAMADFVIENTSNSSALEKKVRAIHDSLSCHSLEKGNPSKS